jgi:hypothetical protein
MGAVRSKRFAMVVEDMKVTYIGVETKYVHSFFCLLVDAHSCIDRALSPFFFYSSLHVGSVFPSLVPPQFWPSFKGYSTCG